MSNGIARLVVELLDLSVVAIVHGTRASDAFAAHLAQVRKMVAEDRDPTDEEVQALQREIEGLRTRLHAEEGRVWTG